MAFHFAPAPPHLASSVRAFWAFDDDGPPSGADERVVPDGCSEIVVHLGAPFVELGPRGYRTQPRALFAGQISKPLWLAASGRVDVFAVRLQPGGARHLGFPPQWMLADGRFEMETVIAPRLRAAWRKALDRLCGTRSFAVRIDAVGGFLERALQPRSADATAFCIDAITACAGSCDLASVAHDAGLSPRQLQRRFMDAVGITPKLFARIVRFQGAFERWGEDPRSWARIAAECGYYDQAHLLRDFRQFAGDPPAAFLAALTPLGGRLIEAAA